MPAPVRLKAMLDARLGPTPATMNIRRVRIAWADSGDVKLRELCARCGGAQTRADILAHACTQCGQGN